MLKTIVVCLPFQTCPSNEEERTGLAGSRQKQNIPGSISRAKMLPDPACHCFARSLRSFMCVCTCSQCMRWRKSWDRCRACIRWSETSRRQRDHSRFLMYQSIILWCVATPSRTNIEDLSQIQRQIWRILQETNAYLFSLNKTKQYASSLYFIKHTNQLSLLKNYSPSTTS